MSIDRSLKIKGHLSRHRNVLTRAERIEKLKDEGRWEEGDSLLGLAKVAHRKSYAGRKSKTEPAKAEGVEVEGAAVETAEDKGKESS